MVRVTAIIIIALILISGCASLQLLANYSKSQSIGDINASINEPTKGSIVHALSDKSDSFSKNKNLNFSLLIKYIEDLMGDFGDFPLGEKGDGYINSTFFGILTMYLLGTLEETRKEDKIPKFLELLYDEEIGGFRNWLGGNVSIKATAYALMVMNATRTQFNEFDANMTLELILNHTSNGAVSEINCAEPDLFTTSLSVIALKILSRIVNTSALNISIEYDAFQEYILSFYNDEKGFCDERIKVPLVIQNYFALKAILLLNVSSLENIKDSLIEILVSLIYNGKDEVLLGGFGSNTTNPTVFETGLCLEMLRVLNYYNESLFNKSIQFVNNSQGESGIIYKNPKMAEGDVFQIAGAVLAYYATDKYSYLVEFKHTIIPSEQVPIDYDNLRLRVEAYIGDDDLDYLDVRYEIDGTNLSGKLVFDNTSAYFIDLLPRALGFGNFTVRIFAYPSSVTLALVPATYNFNFRVGYKIQAKINATTIKPAQTLSVLINVTYSKNNTFVSNGSLILNISSNEELIVSESFTLNATPIKFNWKLPGNISLGTYSILAYVNDSHGKNHTMIVKMFKIIDELNITTLGNFSEIYYPGSLINVSFLIKYNYSGMLAPNTSSVEVIVGADDYTYKRDTVRWVEPGYVNLSTHLPSILPEKTNMSLHLVFKWPGDVEQKYEIARFNVSMGSIFIMNLTQINNLYFYGENLSFQFTIAINETKSFLENATLLIEIVNITESENASLQSMVVTYDANESAYRINETIDPNIPQGEYEILFRLYLPFNDSYVTINPKDMITKIRIEGTLATSDKEISGTFYPDEVIYVGFRVVCQENGRNISSLVLIANVTKEAWNESIIVSEIERGYYRILLSLPEPGSYNVSIYRKADDALIDSFVIDIAQKPGKAMEIFEMLGPAISVGIMATVIIAYIIISWWLGSKVSRRYLIRRLRKR